MTDFTLALKDRAILLGWIVGLLLIPSLLWSLSFPFRATGLMRSANRILIAQNDERRLASPLSQQFAAPVPLGCWYRLANSNSLFFVFAILQDGILVPCGVEISDQGEATGFVPLGSHALKVIDRIPQGLIQVYLRRIESAAAKRMVQR